MLMGLSDLLEGSEDPPRDKNLGLQPSVEQQDSVIGSPGSLTSKETLWPPPSLWLLPLIQAVPPSWVMSVLPRPRGSMWPNMANRAAWELGQTGGWDSPWLGSWIESWGGEMAWEGGDVKE